MGVDVKVEVVHMGMEVVQVEAVQVVEVVHMGVDI
jgi:hypothetical protein